MQHKKAWLDLLTINTSKRIDVGITERRGTEYECCEKERGEEKRDVKQSGEAKESCDRKIPSDNFRNNQKLFWKHVQIERGLSQNTRISVILIKDENGDLVTYVKSVQRRWQDSRDCLYMMVTACLSGC